MIIRLGDRIVITTGRGRIHGMHLANRVVKHTAGYGPRDQPTIRRAALEPVR
jgi:hypothetical protein